VLAQEAQPLDRIAAVVDEDVILQSELQRAIANIKAQYAGRENQLPPEDVLSRQVLERLVLVKLQVARAQGSGIRVSDQELNQAMNSIAQQNGSNLDALRQRLAHDGIDFNDFRARCATRSPCSACARASRRAASASARVKSTPR
jgi:peptidyl-prolyl cis-trans isomerase SurA